MSRMNCILRLSLVLVLLLFAVSAQVLADSAQETEGDWYYSGSTLTAITSSVAGWLTVDSDLETTTTSIVLGATADAHSTATSQGTIEVSGVTAMRVDIYGGLSTSDSNSTAIFFSDATATINNYGTITAKTAIQTSGGNDTVTFNTASSEVYTSGNVILGGGNDTVNFTTVNNDNKMTGSLILGVGNDIVIFSLDDTTATIDAMLTGDGETATTASAINMGKGNDILSINYYGTLTLDGAANTAIVAGDGNDSLSVTATSTTTALTVNLTADDVADGIDLGAGNDRIAFDSQQGDIVFNGVLAGGGGTNTLVITTGSGDTTINGRITTGCENDILTVTLAGGNATVSSIISGTSAVNLDGGDDTLAISGFGTLAVETKNATALTMGTNGDIVTVTATNSTTALTVTLTNNGVADGLELESGNDQVTFTASSGDINFNGALAGGTGTDTLVVTLDNGKTLTATGPIDLGADADTVTIAGAGNMLLTSNYGDTSSLTLGAGDDVVTVSANDATSRLVVTLGGGSNGINLGDGDNQIALNATSNNLILNGDIAGGTDADALSIDVTGGAMTMNGAVRLGDGNNTIAITGNGSAANIATVSGDFYTGAGDDMMTITDAVVAGDIYLGNAGTDIVAFAGSSSVTYDGQIQQATNLIKNGSGTWTLSNAYSAGTRLATVEVNQGTLVIGDSATDVFGDEAGDTNVTIGGAGYGATVRATGVLTANNVTIADGGTLAGTGRVGSKGVVTVNSGGAIAPGNSVGTITIEGDVVFDLDSTYNVEIDGGTADLLTITGTATNDGAYLTTTTAGYITDGASYTVLTAAGGYTENSTFRVVQPTNSAVLTFSQSSGAQTVVITASRRSFQSVSTLPPHLLDMVTSINNLGQGSGDMADIIAALSNLTPEELALAMQQLSPESLNGLAQAGLAITGAMNSGIAGRTSEVRTAMLEQKSNPTGPAGPARTQNAGDGYGVWARSVGSWGDQDDDGDLIGYEYDLYGVVFGIDKQIDDLVIGVSMGYANSDVDANVVDTDSESDSFHLGVYGSYSFDRLYLEGGSSWVHNWNETQRKISFGEISRTAKSDPESNAYSFFLGTGYNLGTGNWIVTPTAGIQYSYLNTESYTEDGAGDLNLSIDENDSDSFITKLGMSVGYMLTEYVRADVRCAWTHEYASLDRSAKAEFNTIGATQFEVESLSPDENMYSIGTGIVAQIEEDVELSLDYNYDTSDEFEAHSISAGIRIDF